MSRWVSLFPTAASTTAGSVDALFFFLLGSSALIALAIFGCLTVFAIKYRRRPGNEVATQVAGSWELEAAWTIVPLVLAMIPFFWGASVYLDLSSPPNDTLDVYVVARQWMWKAEHPDGQAEINELHVPVGRPVRLTMISQDVIHSFFVPEFRTKADVLPGRYTTTWFEATAAGRYRIECAEYCGTDHSQMIGWVTALDEADFANWLASQGTQSLASQGERLFQQLGCDGCHRDDTYARAPALERLYGQPVILQDGGQVLADDAYLRESILNPSAKVVAGWQPIMPTFQGQLDETEIVALLAYLRSIGPPPGSPAPRPRPSPPPRPPLAPATTGSSP
jgi:cytochrome c oxidase subunit 2